MDNMQGIRKPLCKIKKMIMMIMIMNFDYDDVSSLLKKLQIYSINVMLYVIYVLSI